MSGLGGNGDRLEFLLALRADPGLRHQQVDNQRLRELVQDLEAYVNAWNGQLQRIYLRDRRELIAAHDRAIRRLHATGASRTALDDDLQKSLEDAKMRRRELPLAAIREIALAVAGQKDSRHPVLRKLVPFNPVAARRRELRQRYKEFVDQPGAARTEIERAVNNNDLPAKLADMYAMLEDAANQILQQEVLLRDLAGAGRSLADSAAPPALLEDRSQTRYSLTPERIRTLARYFANQAEIESLRFKTLHLASQRFYHQQYPEYRTKRLHRNAIRSFRDSGYTRFNHHVTIAPPTI